MNKSLLVASDSATRPCDLPWMALDSRKAHDIRDWKPEKSLYAILEEIARQTENDAGWLELSAP